MFNRLRTISTDRYGNRLPLNAVAVTLVVKGFFAILAISVIWLLISLYPVFFIAVGAVVAGIWYHSRFGLALPPWISQAIAARGAEKAAEPVAEEPAQRARTAEVTRRTGRETRVGSLSR